MLWVTKLDSFFSPIGVLSKKYKDNSEYVNTIACYRQGKIEEAINTIDSLVQKSHDDPYLYELKAEILYKIGNLREAIKMYEESLKYLAEGKQLFSKTYIISYILLLCGNVKKAIFYLEQTASIESNSAFVWKYLSIAYKHNTDTAMQYFVLTKKACIEGNLKQFIKYSDLAIKTLPKKR